MQILQKNTQHTPDNDCSKYASGPLKEKIKEGEEIGMSGGATRTHNETSPDEVPGSSRTPVEISHPSSLNVDENDLILAMNERYQQETSQANEYDLNSKSAEDLYKYILSQAGYRDISEGDNFALNRKLMVYIKINPCIYKLFLKDASKRMDFFKAVFNSFLFFKTFLTKEATDVMSDISESWKLELHQNIRNLTETPSSEYALFDDAKCLYNDIILENGYKDNAGKNFELNYMFVAYVKMQLQLYVDVLSNENVLNKDAPKMDFFKKVFKSFLFFRNFLIKIV